MRKATMIAAITAALFSTAVWAVSEIMQAPLNPDFVEHMERRARGEITPTFEGRRLGYVPPPFRLPPMPDSVHHALQARSLPARYDLRALGKLTAIRDQGSEGACWAFATYGSMESCLLVQNAGTWDFAENHMVNLHGFDLGFDDGGQHFMSTAYLARWEGPVLESEDPYPRPGRSPTGLSPRKHVQKVIFIPARRNSTDNNAIKQAVKDHGAVYTTMYAGNYLNASTAGYYYNGSAPINHAVVIVGWDDNFSRTKFNTTPPGDGAFIVRNSWGANWGENGYCYISYYDTRVASANAVFMNAEPTSNYAAIYEYDPLGMVTSFGYGNNTAWGANIFTASDNHSLRAASFYAVVAGTKYELYVYTGVTAGQPRSGTLRGSKSGTLNEAGYHTIPLSSAVSLTRSQRFSVVVKLTTPGENFPLAMESAIANYSSRASASPGQSFHSSNGSSWTDLTAYNSTANLCIKAFAGTGTPDPPPPPPPPPAEGTVMNDFDGDGKSDYALYHYPSGRWYIWSSRNNTWLANGPQVGAYGYLPVPGDFDGRGRADPVTYSRWHGHWYGYLQGQRTMLNVNWGGNAFIPVAGDFDGDGTADLALYNTQNGAWFIYGSSAGWMANGQSFGGPGWLPFIADYTGDGRNEIAIYQENTGTWMLYSTLRNQFGRVDNYGGPGFIPVPGDFDGDGTADLSLYNYQTGAWHIWSSRNNRWLARNWSFGGRSYLPVIGDYDGSGRDDVAVYSIATGYWGVYYMSSNTRRIFQWGGPGCAPVVPWWLYWYYGI